MRYVITEAGIKLPLPAPISKKLDDFLKGPVAGDKTKFATAEDYRNELLAESWSRWAI